jgi:carbon-monoxide dehydrogenase medium subunit
MALGAEITCEGRGGSRTIPLMAFFLGYRRTALTPDEIIIEIRVPLAGPGSGSAFHKFGNREADAIAVVSAAAWVSLRDGHIAEARVALGSVAPTVVRAPHVEAALRGRPADGAAMAEASDRVLADISPISDIRGSADYRRALAPILTRRALLDAIARARSRAPSPPPSPLKGDGALFQPLAPLSLAKGGEGTGEGGLGSEHRSPRPRGSSDGTRSGAVRVEFTLNGKSARMDVEPHETLLTALRNRLGLLGAKEGCGQGDCGACTILYDGGPANACLILAGQAAGRRIQTVEGLGTRDRLHPIQEAFIRHGAIQCGFCTPGLLMSAKALLDRTPDPNPAQIRMGISGNLCRCTGYTKIVQAVLEAARLLGTRAGGRASPPRVDQ